MFDAHRVKLLETVTPVINKLNLELDNSVLDKILLYGDRALNPTQNKIILEATLDYIRKSGRLSHEPES